jgi:excisionase family DNA binding protein
MPPGTAPATAGHRTGHGRPFDIDAVQWIRHAYKIPVPDPYRPGEISVAEAARQLGCSTGVIYHWIHTGQLTARRGSASRFCIPWNAQAEAGSRTRIAQSAHLGWAGPPVPARSRHPRSPPTAAARSASPKPPASSAAAPASSTTGSKPGS